MLQRVITSLVAARRVPDWWFPLFEIASRPSIFLSADWLQTWIDVYGDEFEGQWIRWEEGGTVVGGCLIIARTVRKSLVGIRSVYLNATGDASVRTPFAEFNDVLCAAGYTDAIATSLSHFLSTQRWDRILLSGYEEGGVIDKLLPMMYTSAVETAPQLASYIDLDALNTDSPTNAVSPNTRGQIRRSRRLYEQRAGPLILRRAENLKEGGVFLDNLAALHNVRRGIKGEQGSFESKHVMTFHKQLLARLWNTARVDLLRLRTGDQDVGYLYNFIFRGKVYFFQSGFVYESDQKLKPGLLMHSLAIEKYRLEGLQEYDFLVGDSQYKRSLAKQSRTLYWSTIYRGTWKIQQLLRLRHIFRWIRK